MFLASNALELTHILIMENIVTISVILGGAVLAAVAASIGMSGTIQMTSRRGHGYLHLIFYIMLLLVALPNLISGRDLTTTPLSMMERGDSVRAPLMALLQPVFSLLILALAGERIISHWIKPQKDTQVPVVLLTVFIIFWAGTVLAPALLGAHPKISHDYLYSLVIGIAVLLASGIERDMAFRAARDALFVFMVAGLLLIPVLPATVMDVAYTQGLIPGLPRLAGLAAHPVSLGALAQLGLLCLLACPYRRRWLNRLAWLVGLSVLFLAQSKTSWVSFALCAACIVLARSGGNFMRRAGDPQRSELGIVTLLVFMAVVALIGGVLMFGNLDSRLASFFDSSEGAQLTSLTGRDQIWAIAYDEWQRNPLFGYGPTIWDENFRTAIGMPNATHAHNQFMDTLSRSGAVGAAALVLYALVLLVSSVRYTRVSGGLTLALFLALALRSVSEVPLDIFGYGTELLTHMLLLMTLAAAASASRVAAKSTAAARHQVYATGPIPASAVRISL